MTFDFVHDTQVLFRKLLTATSFPGTVVELGAEAAKIETGSGINAAMIGCALTLLDAETTFCVWPQEAWEHARLLCQLTDARAVAPEDAEFQFVLPGRADAAGEALRSACVGTLVEPHRGATLCIEVSAVRGGRATRGAGAHAGAGMLSPGAGALLIEGPGIKGSALIEVEGLDPAWVAMRADRCAEYPLGIDLYLVDDAGRLIGIPRTSRLSVAG